jgi:hypothetical protein
VACSTVLAAGAVSGAVVLWPGSVAARQAVGVGDMAVGHAGATATQPRLGQAIPDFESQHARTDAAAAFRGARLAARARAAVRAARARAAASAKAAQERAAELAAQPKPTSSPVAAATPAPVAASGSPQQIAISMLSSYGWSSQFSCLNELWDRESGWNPTAENPSGAYGIPQALPGSKMASAGPDWETSAATQIKWGLGYIQGTYGSPCAAWSHEEATGWY